MKHRSGLLTLALIFMATLCWGCATTVISAPDDTLLITSEPSGATVDISSGEECVTPCSVTLKRHATYTLKVYKTGYLPKTIFVSPQTTTTSIGMMGAADQLSASAPLRLAPNPAHAVLSPDSATFKSQ